MLVAFLSAPILSSAQQAPSPPRLFARVTMLKAKEGKEKDFENFVRDRIKPLQALRRQQGKIALWIFFKVHFAGQGDDYNYVGVTYAPAWASMETEPWASLLKEMDADADVGAFLASQRELRTMVREHVLYQLEALEPNPPVPSRYVRLDYMKTRPGKTSDYLKLEREDWMPFHQTLINDGQCSGWGLWQVVFPGGTGLPYDYVTSNRYSTYAQVLATDYEKTFKKATPAKNVNDVFNRTTQSRDIVKSELWEVVEILN